MTSNVRHAIHPAVMNAAEKRVAGGKVLSPHEIQDIHTNIHSHIQTDIHACMHAYIHTYIHNTYIHYITYIHM